MTVTAVTSLKQFQEIINGDNVAVFDFWATWCGPCRVISPIFEKLSSTEEFSSISFYKVDVDECNDISGLAGVRAMPTFIVYKKGEKVNELVGAVPAKLQLLLETASQL